jgi:hypothetical protein
MAEVWDGVNLKFTFRKTVDRNLMNIWEEVVQIENSIQFSEEDDAGCGSLVLSPCMQWSTIEGLNKCLPMLCRRLEFLLGFISHQR